MTATEKSKRPKVRIYVEGGSSEIADVFRKAWVQFFEKAGLKNQMPRTISGEGRSQTFDLFKTAVERRSPDELLLLLLDSEDPIAPGRSNWEHLKWRDNFDKPAAAGDDDALLMVRVMETWIIADRQALQTFFPGLRENHLPAWTKLEVVPKTDVIAALERATAGCKRHYAKGRLSFELLAIVNPLEVEQRCPAAKRMLDRLRSLLS